MQTHTNAPAEPDAEGVGTPLHTPLTHPAHPLAHPPQRVRGQGWRGAAELAHAAKRPAVLTKANVPNLFF